MKILYLDCSMGAAGDMLAAALLELLPDPEQFVERLNDLQLPSVTFQMESAVKCGIVGTHMRVYVNGDAEEISHHDHGHSHRDDHGHSHMCGHSHHAHHSLHDITQIVSHLELPQAVQKNILAVYNLIAEAESHVHGQPISEIHFHEVGTLDAIADVTAVCLLLYELAPEQILSSPVNVGSGQVHCAHGILPVPAPATAQLLQRIPTYGSQIPGELCTPTGAALLRYFVQTFGSQPPMCVERIGYGCGQKDFEMANCVRAMLGKSIECSGMGH